MRGMGVGRMEQERGKEPGAAIRGDENINGWRDEERKAAETHFVKKKTLWHLLYYLNLKIFKYKKPYMYYEVRAICSH